MEVNLLKFASTEAITEAFTEAFVDVKNKLEIIHNNFLPRKVSKTYPMETSTIASVKENYCHESFCESFRHMVDTLLK